MSIFLYILACIVLLAVAGFCIWKRPRVREFVHKHENHVVHEQDALPEDPVPKSRILIVQDDKTHRFLRESLGEDYELICLYDGNEGLEYARQYGPDLIISGLRLPGISGEDICRAIGSSPETNHIPVIIYSSNTEKESIIYCLEAGAADYIVKPADPAILKARIKNIIEYRQALRQSILNMGKDEPEPEYENKLEQDFMDSVAEIASRHLDDEGFVMDDFSKEMKMSRTSFYNKIKALTGQSPNEFMKIYRLNRAKEFLKEKKYTIAEISTMVGFSDPKYFSICFKKQFGVSPSKME